MEHLDDDELLARTPSCPAAFAVFYRRHERRVLAYLRHRWTNRDGTGGTFKVTDPFGSRADCR